MRRILWFRRDLRTEDNPLLSQEGDVLPVFIFDPAILDNLPENDRRVTFIFKALMRLKGELKTRGLDLALFYGRPSDIFRWLLQQRHFGDVCASGDYDPKARERDRDVSHLLPFTYLHDTYLFRPDEVLKNDGSPYLVFTPFYNRVKALFRPEHLAESAAAPQSLVPFDYEAIHRIEGDTHTRLALSLNSIRFVEQSLTPQQQRSPEEKLNAFAEKLGNYPHDRDFMALEATSSLSTDLRFGTIGVRSLLRWLRDQKKEQIDTEPFFRQLIFREFYAMLLYHYPHLAERNFRYPFRGIENNGYFEAFSSARTGVPIIDAGLRQLLTTGEMHNRVRMICASFFTKNLLLPWQWGEQFFARHLMDYDAASNILSWQWSAGTGVDPQPYFRIFNPYTQSKKFDPDGAYLQRWIPELRGITPSHLHDESKLFSLDLHYYPHPVVEHKASSQKALEYFKRHIH